MSKSTFLGLDSDSSLCTSDTVGLTESRTRVLTNGLDLEVIYSNTNSRGLVILILIILIESYHTTQSTSRLYYILPYNSCEQIFSR